jgi:hypothetical protein
LLRDDTTDTLPSVTFSFSDTPMSGFPSGTGAPYPVPTGSYGSGSPILICHPVDGTPNNGTMSALPSGPSPTSSPPVPTASAPVPTDGKGSGGPIYICYPADSAAAPSGSVSPSDAPSFSLPTGTDAPQPKPTDGQGSGGSVFLQCSPVPNDASGTPISSGPAPTSAPADA